MWKEGWNNLYESSFGQFVGKRRWSFQMWSVGSWVGLCVKVLVGPAWWTLRGWMYGSHCSAP